MPSRWSGSAQHAPARTRRESQKTKPATRADSHCDPRVNACVGGEGETPAKAEAEQADGGQPVQGQA
jgi:hypothetical protein